jgi:hypothetical protein
MKALLLADARITVGLLVCACALNVPNLSCGNARKD